MRIRVINRPLATARAASCDGGVSICSSVCRQIAKSRFFSKLSNLDLWSLLTTYIVHGLFKEAIVRPIKSKMAEIRQLGSWRQNLKRQFSQKLSNLKVRCLMTTYRQLCNWTFQRTQNWIPKIQDGWDPPSLDKISPASAEWHVDCGDVVEIETRCRIRIWRTFARIQWRHPRATCHIVGCCHRANSMACHARATYHIAGCCHLMNSLSRFQSHMPHCRV